MALLRQAPQLPKGQGRIEAIDLARGVAIALMILSHTVTGLLGLSLVPDWGMVPIHLVTKFSSSLFILVFGIALAVAFLPHVGSESWPRRRLKLWVRALVVLFWYKALTVIEMLPLYGPGDILDTLLYQRFAIWVEILGFYAIALLWVPLILPLWMRAPLWSRLLSIGVMTGLAWLLLEHFHFWGNPLLQALLVDHPDHYTWGQLSRAPLIFAGLLLGEAVLRCYWQPPFRRRLVLAIGGMGVTMLLGFLALSAAQLDEQWLAVARNIGKHPPELRFMLFSVGGALVILALALLGGERLARWLRPITIVGSDALKAFIFHIVVIFLILRFLLGYWQAFSYPQVLGIGGLLILATAAWIKLTAWIEARS
ncbi:DUF1624 domain-containing protein [Halomonas sp. PA5]|nr:DUF1624 domain-containing protein [Halomonas sp. PA5]